MTQNDAIGKKYHGPHYDNRQIRKLIIRSCGLCQETIVFALYSNMMRHKQASQRPFVDIVFAATGEREDADVTPCRNVIITASNLSGSDLRISSGWVSHGAGRILEAVTLGDESGRASS